MIKKMTPSTRFQSKIPKIGSSCSSRKASTESSKENRAKITGNLAKRLANEPNSKGVVRTKIHLTYQAARRSFVPETKMSFTHRPNFSGLNASSSLGKKALERTEKKRSNKFCGKTKKILNQNSWVSQSSDFLGNSTDYCPKTEMAIYKTQDIRPKSS